MVARDGLSEKGEICCSSETAIHVHVARRLFFGARPGGMVLGSWRAVEMDGIYCENESVGLIDSWWFVIDGCTAYGREGILMLWCRDLATNIENRQLA
jgi:hypothetical protein